MYVHYHMCDKQVQMIWGMCVTYICMWVCGVSSLLPTDPTHWPTLTLHVLFSVHSTGEL